MKKLGLWLWLLLKRQLKNPVVSIFLLGMPAVAAVIVKLPAMNQTQIPRVGIVASDRDALSNRVLNQLLEGEYSIDFYRASDYETLKEDVRSGKAECGYIFDNSLTKRYSQRNYKNSVLQLKSSSDFVPAMAREIVFAALFSVHARDIAADYVRTSPVFERYEDRAVQMVSDSYDAYLSGTMTFHMKFSILDNENDGKMTAIAGGAGSFPVRGILGILVYLAGLFGCVQWKIDEEKGVFLTLPYGFKIASRPLYSLIPTMLFAVSAELTMAISHTADYPLELWKMGSYVVMIILFSWLMNILLPSARAVVSVIPVLLIASMILCPVFVNLLAAFPAAEYIARLLLPYYYLL
ncbi:MAG: hypothetical protein Q4F11_04700 [Eubacteriales bacterium]|nr:hypothetical protein [Eubacteriales bacterium]